MSQIEKLRALLAEARECVRDFGETLTCDAESHRFHTSPCQACYVGAVADRIDAALAEPVEVHPSNLTTIIDVLESDLDAARGVLSALCAEFEGAVAHADWRAAGSPGMSVPFTGDFASATQLPSVVGRLRWWAREMRKVIGGGKS